MKHMHRKLIALENMSALRKTPDATSSTANFYEKPPLDGTFGARGPTTGVDRLPSAVHEKPESRQG